METNDISILETNQNIFHHLSEDCYNILLSHNFFGILGNVFTDVITTNDTIRCLSIIYYFTNISIDVSEQLLGTFYSHLCNFLLPGKNELYIPCLYIIYNFCLQPSIAKFFLENNQTNNIINSLTKIFFRTIHQNLKEMIVAIFYKMSKVLNSDFLEDFLKVAINESVSLVLTIKLLCKLSIKIVHTENRFIKNSFLKKIKDTLISEINNENEKFIKNCLFFINNRCCFTFEALAFYDSEISHVLIDVLPTKYLIYACPIFLCFLEKIPDSTNDEIITKLINKLNVMINSGIFSEKEAAICVISKMVCKVPSLYENELIFANIIHSLDFLLSDNFLTVKIFLDLLISICEREKSQNTHNFIDVIIENGIQSMLDQISEYQQLEKRTTILHQILFEQNKE